MRIFYKLNEILNLGYNVILCGDFNTITRHYLKGKLLKKVCENYKLKNTYSVETNFLTTSVAPALTELSESMNLCL